MQGTHMVVAEKEKNLLSKRFGLIPEIKKRQRNG
jgi:hypothetical protein